MVSPRCHCPVQHYRVAPVMLCPVVPVPSTHPMSPPLLSVPGLEGSWGSPNPPPGAVG